MTINKRAPAKSILRVIFSLVMFCACLVPFGILISSGAALFAQTAADGNPAPGGVRGVINFDSGWRFQVGDDFRWADPAFDDRDWQAVTLSNSLAEQGIGSYYGFGWYRMRLQPQRLEALRNSASQAPLFLLITSNTVGQLEVYVNGVVAGRSSGMKEDPSEYQSPPFVIQLRRRRQRYNHLAVRSWAGPSIKIQRGLLKKAEIGTRADIDERSQWHGGSSGTRGPSQRLQ